MSEFIDVCEQAARAGSEQLLRWRGSFATREKGPKDLVTDADLASQDAIRRVVEAAYPDHRFLGEESDDTSDWASFSRGFCWVVDPLDGTTNYVHDLPAFSVSVALVHDGEPVAGVVLDPMLNECYRAVRGEGAELNGEPIRVSDCQEVSGALVAASFTADVRRDSEEVDRFVEMLYHCQAVRRLGSAALNLCYTGAGRLDGYWAASVKSWDVAAGVLIVREAGGQVTNLEGGRFDFGRPRLLAASTRPLHQQILSILSRA
ncbi:MAG: inositol monophosphatase family protein [Pirellulaceae bacterium]|jgi:myo-inositol-1(or 4)-monophosphatase|nr:inositol monophosphatase family protein [Pirellulaceae bacterium]